LYAEYRKERRGNRIEDSAVWRVEGDESGEARIFDVRTSDDVVDHLRLIVAGAVQVYQPPSELMPRFTHRIYMPDGPGTVCERALETLSTALTLSVPGVDLGVAMDWYSIPTEGVVAADWPHTELGELRYRAKYYVKYTPAKAASARAELARRLADFVGEHPTFASATAIVTCPGHDRSETSCSESLARRMGIELGIDVVETQTAHEVRPEAKAGGYFDLEAEFSMPRTLSGLSVIIVDDTLQSGETMRCVARAARLAGATTVLGLVPVRNLRGSRR
jgi:hypothetical protein